MDFHLSALKPEAEMASEASRGRYDLDKPENITGRYRQSNRTSWKNGVIRITQKPLEPSLKLKIQLLAEFCHPSCDMNFADPREKCESLCFKPTTQRNLKHPAPSVRALVFIRCFPQNRSLFTSLVIFSRLNCFLDKVILTQIYYLNLVSSVEIQSVSQNRQFTYHKD